jgi:hypothetical protein
MNAPPLYRLEQCIAALPGPARRRYGRLQAAITDAQALVRSNLQREALLEDSLNDIKRRLHYSTDADTVARLREDLTEFSAELASLGDERSKRNAARGNAEQTLSQLNNFIGRLFLDGTPRLRSVAVEASPRDGESLADAILRTRAAIRAAQAALLAVKDAPLPPDEIKRALTAAIDRMAAEGGPQLDLVGGKVVIRWPDVSEFAGANAAFAAPSGGASKLMAWLWRDRLIEALTSGIDEITGGVPAAARAGRIAEMEAEVLRLERDEESLVEMALAAGLEVHRRYGASPLALLGIEVMSAVDEAVPAEAAE